MQSQKTADVFEPQLCSLTMTQMMEAMANMDIIMMTETVNLNDTINLSNLV